MSRDDHIRKEVINSIMCQGIVDIAAIETHNAINFGEYFAPESERLLILQADGLVELNRKYIALTAVGRLLMRTVAMAFDAYVNAAPVCTAPQPAAMSRVI
jgi:oxygen-independent coproporphyrinogen III oxidase